MERRRMAQQSKREYLESIDLRYRQSSRLEKQRILDEFMRVCGYHRKYAIGLLNRPLPEPRPRRVPTRQPRYSAAVIEVLAERWTASGYLCAVRLKAALPTWLPWLRRRRILSPEQERQLLAISPRQLERRLRTHKERVKRRVYGTTRPGSLLKHMIPIKTEQWEVTKAGYLEIDLVSHSGATADGEYLYTLDAVDLHTGWVERQAVRGKGHQGILAALQAIAQRLPFALSQRVDAQLEQVWQLAHRVTRQPRATRPKVAHQPRAVTPWRDGIFSDRLKQQHRAQRRTASAAR
jgi:hypothetical protein